VQYVTAQSPVPPDRAVTYCTYNTPHFAYLKDIE